MTGAWSTSKSGFAREHHIGTTYLFCMECLGSPTDGKHIGETASFRHDDKQHAWGFVAYESSLSKLSDFDPGTGFHAPASTTTTGDEEEDECILTFDEDRYRTCASFECNPKSEDDFLAMDCTITEDVVDVKGAEAEEENLLRTAWALLLENRDLCEFAWCLHGTGSFDCLEKHITGDLSCVWFPVVVDITVKEYDKHWVIQFVSGDDWDWLGGWIRINRRKIQWQKVMEVWNDPCSTPDKVCCAIEVSAWLFHELSHICCWPSSDSPLEEYTVSMEKAYRWAMYNRYWCAVRESNCCRQFFEGGAVGDGLLVHAYDTCVPTGVLWGTDNEDWEACEP